MVQNNKMNDKNDIKRKLGNRIQFLRKLKGFTQENFAELIDIEPQSLSNIERGKFAPSIETLQKIANTLGVEIFELYLFENGEILDSMRMELIEAINKSKIVTYDLYKYYYREKQFVFGIK